MALCEQSIKKNILSACARTAAGLDNGRIWLFPKSTISLSFNTSTDDDKSVYSIEGTPNAGVITISSDAIGYIGTFSKRMFSAGFSRVISEAQPDTFQQTINIVGVQFDQSSKINFDTLGNVVAIVERKGIDGEGNFMILGSETGLYVSADSYNSNESNGARNLTLSSLDGEGESTSYKVLYTKYDSTAGTVTSPEVGDTITDASVEAYLDALCDQVGA